MKINGYFIAVFSIIIFIVHPVFGQERGESVLKFGLNPSGNAVAMHFELEKYFKRKPIFTHGPGMDLTIFGYSREITYKYNFAFYPFYGLGKKGPYNWLFVGAGPIFYHNFFMPGPNHGSATNRYGPGISGFAGIQYMLNDRFTLGVDMAIGYFKDLKNDSWDNHMYFINTWGIKLGFIIR